MDTERVDRSAEQVNTVLSNFQAIPSAGLTDDIAAAAVFLASDEASFVNGEDIVVDGGLIWGRRHSDVVKGGGAWSQLFE